jgi:hypothetical protein
MLLRIPRADHVILECEPFFVPTRVRKLEDSLWHQIVEVLRAAPQETAGYGQILHSSGLYGNSEGAKSVRRTLSQLIRGGFPNSPAVERVSRGLYRPVPIEVDE